MLEEVVATATLDLYFTTQLMARILSFIYYYFSLMVGVEDHVNLFLYSGIILVHDLTNRKSEQNLQKWLAEVLHREGNSKFKNHTFDDFDPEQFVGSTQV